MNIDNQYEVITIFITQPRSLFNGTLNPCDVATQYSHAIVVRHGNL